jgi:hypothetical protein
MWVGSAVVATPSGPHQVEPASHRRAKHWVDIADAESIRQIYRARHHGREDRMSKLLGFVGASVGGSFGWWLGDRGGLLAAFSLSMVGTGVGLYLGRRFADELGG